jgi:hypothetical protein
MKAFGNIAALLLVFPISLSAQARVAASPTSLTFAANYQGPFPTQNITLQNATPYAVLFSSINVTGAFSQFNNCGGSIRFAGNCTMSVALNFPAAPGPQTGSVTVNYTFGPPGGQQTHGTTTIGLSGTAYGTQVLPPKYKIVSILYSPPGNASTNGYSNAVSAGDTTSIGQTFAESQMAQVTFTGGLSPNQVTFGVIFGFGSSTGTSDSFQTTYQGVTQTQLGSTRQPIDHTQDQFYLWLNPAVTVKQTSANAVSYSLGTVNGQPMDIINVNAAGLQNPALIPLAVLLPQTVEPGVTLPGLANICANPLPPPNCTQANACGCVPNDFAAIVAEDPLIGTSQMTPPTSIDPNRFVLVNFQTLEGPAQPGGGAVKNTFSESDSTLASHTNTATQSTTVGYINGFQVGAPGFSVRYQNTTTFTWTDMESYGMSNGTAHTAMVTLGSSNVGCFEDIDIYEDTVYHTYAFALPSSPPVACQ